MRIFYAAGSQPHGSLAGSRVWHYNLFLPLCDLGHDVHVFEYDLEPHYANANPANPLAAGFIASQRPRLGEELLRQVREVHRQQRVDLFFSYFYSSFVDREVIRTIRDMGIVTVNWYCNASYQFDLVSEIAPAFDFCLVPEKSRLEDYRAMGANPIHCQEAANPTLYKPFPLQQDYDVTFVGACYGDRPHHIRYLVDRGVDARAWGPGWLDLRRPSSHWSRVRRAGSQVKRRLAGRAAPPWIPAESCGGPLSDEDMVRLYSRSKISLGFSKVGETWRDRTPIKQVRLRDFEAPMSGAFYMVEYCEELEEFFAPGKEIVCFQDNDELRRLANYYLIHDEEREAIRWAGYRRARAEHTWQIRLAQVFRQMGLS